MVDTIIKNIQYGGKTFPVYRLIEGKNSRSKLCPNTKFGTWSQCGISLYIW